MNLGSGVYPTDGVRKDDDNHISLCAGVIVVNLYGRPHIFSYQMITERAGVI